MIQKIEGPFYKTVDTVLGEDGDNPEAAMPGFGWPVGSECCYFRLKCFGYRLIATGLTAGSALRRAATLLELREQREQKAAQQ